MDRYNMRQAAAALGYSNRNFLRRKSDGFFPPARVDRSGRPYYTESDIEACREAVRTGVGHNGDERGLYGGRGGNSSPRASGRGSQPEIWP